MCVPFTDILSSCGMSTRTTTWDQKSENAGSILDTSAFRHGRSISFSFIVEALGRATLCIVANLVPASVSTTVFGYMTIIVFFIILVVHLNHLPMLSLQSNQRMVTHWLLALSFALAQIIVQAYSSQTKVRHWLKLLFVPSLKVESVMTLLFGVALSVIDCDR